MVKAQLPPNEAERLAELREYHILDTLSEQAYDDVTFLAARICGTPIALISFVDAERQWFKSRVGLAATETPREVAFCAHAITRPQDLMVVPDAEKDPRFAANPLVTSDPHIRFYAGAPLVTPTGNALGALCVIDRVTRELSAPQQDSLRALSRQVMTHLELRKMVAERDAHLAERREYEQRLEAYQRRLEENNAALEVLSSSDALTGLPNRRVFLNRLEEEIARASRYDMPLSLAILDVDHFKQYNDTRGHLAGDVVLRRVGEVLRSSARAGDIVARIGGEEFAVILPSTRREGASVLGERFRQAIAREPWPDRAMTVSVGVATIAGGTIERSAFMAAADAALYQAKQGGRNRVAAAATPDLVPAAPPTAELRRRRPA